MKKKRKENNNLSVHKNDIEPECVCDAFQSSQYLHSLTKSRTQFQVKVCNGKNQGASIKWSKGQIDCARLHLEDKFKLKICTKNYNETLFFFFKFHIYLLLS